MNVNLYDLLDDLEPAELELFPPESALELPKGVTPSSVRRKVQTPRLRSFRWQNVAAVAACACILIAFGFGIGRWSGSNGLGTPGAPTPGKPDNFMSDSENQDSNPGVTQGDEDPVTAIVLRNLDAYEQMYAMAQTEDEEALRQYLSSIEGGGAESREDILDFLDVMALLPIPELIEGKVIFLQYRADAQDATITLMARDGSWIRITYYLYADSDSLEDRYESGEFANSELDVPISSEDRTNSIYNETRAPYPVGSGSEIVWDIQIAGITAQIYYYTNDAETVNTQALLQNLKLTNIATMMQ